MARLTGVLDRFATMLAGGVGSGQRSTSEAPSEEPDAEASEPPTVEIGEKVRDEGYQFTVTKVTCGVKRVGDIYLGEKAQGQFCLLKMREKNVSKNRSISPMRIRR